MRKSCFAALAAFALAAQVSPAAGEMLSPSEVVQRAFAPKLRVLTECGVRTGAVARFGIGFDGKVTGLRFEGIDADTTRLCVSRHLRQVQVPTRLAFIVREVKLPLVSQN
jgi:hypothetical protein